MESNSQGSVEPSSEPNALWSVLFTSSQEQLAPPLESQPQQQTLPPSESQHQAQHGTSLLGKESSQNEPDLPCQDRQLPDKMVAAEKISAGQQTVTGKTETAEIADATSPVADSCHGITRSPSREFVPPPVLETELQPQLFNQTIKAASLLAVSCRSDGQEAYASRYTATHWETDADVRSPAPPPSSLLPQSSLTLNLLPFSELLEDVREPDPDGGNGPTAVGMEARVHGAVAAAAPAPKQASLPYRQQHEEASGLEDTLEDELCDSDAEVPAPDAAAARDATQGRQPADDDLGACGHRLKRLRRAPIPPLPAAAAASQPSPALKRKAAADSLDEGDAAAVVAASGGGGGGDSGARPVKALRKRVVVRSAVGDDFDDLEPQDAAAGRRRSEGCEVPGREAGGAAGGAEGAATAEAEGEAEQPEAGVEEEEDVAGAAAGEEDPEVAKQRMLREAALRDRIGGRAVPDAPVRPLTDVLSRIMARQKSLVDRTRANDPVLLAQPVAPAGASAHQPQPAAPPTFNVRALMKSLSESKQQQSQQPQAGTGHGGGADADGGSTVVASAAASQCPDRAAVAKADTWTGTDGGKSGEPSQLDLDLQLHGSEMEGLNAPAVTETRVRQQQQRGEGGAETAAEGDVFMEGAGNVGGSSAAARGGGDVEDDGDGELLVVEEQAPPPAKSPIGVIRGLRPLDAAAAGPMGLSLLYDTQALLYDDASQQQTHQAQEESKDPQKTPGCDRSRARTATVIPLVDLAHRAPSITVKSGSGSGAEDSKGHAGLDLDLDLDLDEEDDLIVEPDPEAGDSKLPTDEHQQMAAAAATGTATGGDGKAKDPTVQSDAQGTTMRTEREAEEEADEAEAAGDEDEGDEEEVADEEEEEEDLEEEAGEGEEEAEEEEEGAAACGEGEEGDGAGEEEEAEDGLVYDVDEEFDSTDEEDAVEPEGLRFEEEEAATAASAGLLDEGATAAGAQADADVAVALERRRKLTDVLIAAAKKRRAEQLAEAKRRAAAERGAGAFFVDVEAELSDEEEGIAALDDLEDEYDGEDLDEGVLASLLGNAKDSALDEVRRAELHALWEAERDTAAVKELVEAVRRGFRRRRKNGLGELENDDEDLTDNDARRRRANLFASTIDEDDDAPIKVAKGHGLDLDLAREDDEEDLDALPPPGSATATQDGSQAAVGSSGGGAGASNGNGNGPLPPLAARAGARFPLGRSGPGFGFSGNSLSRLMDPVEAKRLLRQQSQEAAAAATAAAARRQEDGAGGSSPRNPLDPSPLRAAAAAAARHSDDVVALLQRSASAAAGLFSPREMAAAAEKTAGGAGVGGAEHKFTLFGSDITNRAGGGGGSGSGSGAADRFPGGAGASTFLGRSAAPTNLRTSSNTAAGVNTRSYVFAADASTSTFPEKSRDTNVATNADGGAAQGGGGGVGGTAAAAPSFAALRAVIAQPRGSSGGEGSGGGGGGALMGLLGLGSLGVAGGGGSGAMGKAVGIPAVDLKRKLVTGGMPASKRRL
ncbi:hypothetical protein VaNZ11_012635 [Volvox africanus]|uniref:DNA replication checkpoint mediator MRC1 domain-containing protein n=1 Tax=Volvox africanus TaxID=51714 RepID=A0ABQ5SEB3_9CHLO|nr:hypothetical protein VaNZ11_012635 [Volvox africanus]